jgi:hypothetical protein
MQNKNDYTQATVAVAPKEYTMQTKTSQKKKRKESTVGWIRTSDLPTLEREIRNLGKANRGLGYQVGCADHCTTTAFWVGRT